MQHLKTKVVRLFNDANSWEEPNEYIAIGSVKI